MPRLDRPNGAALWTAEDFQLVADMLDAGNSMREIAIALGRSQEAVRNKAWRRGLLPPRPKKLA